MDALNELKLKTIDDFKAYLKRLYKGHMEPCPQLLNLIYYIENHRVINNPDSTLEKLLIWK